MLADYEKFGITCPACHADILEALVIDLPFAHEILEYAMGKETEFRLMMEERALKVREEGPHLREQESKKKAGK